MKNKKQKKIQKVLCNLNAVIHKIFNLFIIFSVFKIVSFKRQTVFMKMSKIKMFFNKHADLLLGKVIKFRINYQQGNLLNNMIKILFLKIQVLMMIFFQILFLIKKLKIKMKMIFSEEIKIYKDKKIIEEVLKN